MAYLVLSLVGYVESSTAAETSIPKVVEPLPSHWRQLHIDEPVFGNTVRVVETGLQHAKTLVLIHGLGSNGLLDWKTVIEQLEHNYHIVALDLPGFGQSDSTSLQLAPQRYAKLLLWLIPQFTQQKMTVIGHSMGGAISLRFAAEHPELVDKLIMVDTAGVLQRSVFVRHMTLMPDTYDFLGDYQQRFDLLDSAVKKVNHLLDKWSGILLKQLDKLPDPTQVLLENPVAQQYIYKDRPTLNAALGLIYEDLSDAITKLSVPTHIIWGENDRVAPLRTGKLLQFQLQQAELSIIKDAGHVPMHDQPQLFMQQLTYALDTPPAKKHTQNIAATGPLSSLFCNKQNDFSYTGHFEQIYINNCQHIKLINVSANSIVIKGSSVNLQQVEVNTEALALDVDNATVTLTNTTLRGSTALRVNNSTIDAAGVAFIATHHPIKIINNALLYFSISHSQVAGKYRGLHGMSLGNELTVR